MLGYVRDNSKQQTEQFNQQDKRLTKQAFQSPMASTSTQRAPSTTASSTHSKKYEVFLSFRGADTRFGFTDHLYEALKRIGIIVFRDTEELEEGEEIYPSLKEAIEQSQYAVVVISEKFAESKSCLFELTVIMECRQMGRLTVFPIFYYVDPSSVRNQEGSFGDAFVKLKDDPKVDTSKWESWKVVLTKIGDCSLDPSKVDEDVLESCRGALEKVGNLSGWHVQNRSESEIVEEIGLKIFSQLMRNSRGIDESLVGIESPVREIMELLNLKSGSVCYIGVCRMGGVGKTTLANIVYERASPEFEAHCNISSIGESKNSCLVALQRQIISAILSVEVEKSLSTDYAVMKALKSRLRSKKVLIVLDDMCHREQLKKLAGSDNWFGEGSRIIITSREQHLPPYLHGDNIFVVNELNYNDSLQLFCSKAFKNCHLQKGFERLIEDIVNIAGGLPLALEIFGSYVYNKRKSTWESYLDRLKTSLNPDIKEKLEITFDRLEDVAKEVFSEIACFFLRKTKSYIISKLKCLGYPSESILNDLECKSLIKFDKDGKLFIHDLLIHMGVEYGKQKRLWRIDDIIPLLREKIETTGIDELTGVRINLSFIKEKIPSSLCFDVFEKMKSLLKIIDHHGLEFCEKCSKVLPMQWYGKASKLKLSSELRVLEWWQYPLEFLPLESSFDLTNLVELILRYSHIKRLWNGNKWFLNLKHIDLRFSQKLMEISDLSQVPNLEILNLSYCESLLMVHSSVGLLKWLRELLLKDCYNLELLPDQIISESLEVFDISHCLKLKGFWDITGKMSSLRRLDIRMITIEEFPSIFMTLPPIEEFLVEGARFGDLLFEVVFEGEILDVKCYGSKTCFRLPPFYSSVSILRRLILHGWSPSDAKESVCSSVLLECTYDKLREFLEDPFSGLRSLLKVRLNNRNLGTICKFTGGQYLISELVLIRNRFTKLPDNIYGLLNVEELVLDDCTSFRTLPKLPLSLRNLRIRNCASFQKLPNSMCELSNLKSLNLDNCISLQALPKMPLSLLTLTISDCASFQELPNSMYELSNLKSLNLNNCISLQTLPKLPLSLYLLEASNCPQLRVRNCPLISLDLSESVCLLSEVLDSQMTPQTLRELMQIRPRYYTVAYIGFHCKPHKILSQHLRGYGVHKMEPIAVTCSPRLGSEIPGWFTHKSTSFNNKIQI